MRIFVCGAIAAVLAFSQIDAQRLQQTGGLSLTGRVVTGTGADARPVRRATVTLAGQGLTTSRFADTDAKGTYRFDRLPAGEYKITVRKVGFVKLDADATPNATLTMIRGGAIEGAVTDAAGDPVSDVLVTALQRQPDDPSTQLGAGSSTQPGASAKAKAIAQTRTDDLGRYRLHSLPASDYLVEAATDMSYLPNVFLMPGEKRPGVSQGYYPAAATIDESKPVRVSPGRDVSGVDITFVPAAPVTDPAAPRLPPRPDATGTAKIAGTVADAVTGKPIRGARLLLLPVEGQRTTNWTRADAQGRFEYTALQARRYTLRAEADRFVTLQFGQKRPGETGTRIEVRDGEDFRADIKLPRASALEGTVLDEFGDPTPGVLVQVAQRQYAAGRQRLIPAVGRLSRPTDDRGRYRISGLAPAEYVVVALSGAYANEMAVGGFAPTYYPGTTDAGAATPVTIAFGADTTGTTFALEPAKTFSVSGAMVDAEGKPLSGRGNLWLATPDRLQRMDFLMARGLTSPDGRFFLRNVPQGQYTMQGFGPPPADYRGPGNLGAMSFGWLPITVGDSDLDDVVLKVTGGTSLRGKIVLDDPAVTPPKPDQVRVAAFPVEFDSAPMAGGPPPSETHDDWTFEVSRMSGLRRIFVTVQAPTWALKKITLNDLDVTDSPVDLRTKNIEGVQVVLTPKVSRIGGAVSDDKGLISDYAVVIFASDPTKWLDRSRFVVMARPTQQGRFEVRGLPQEDYLAVALPNVVGNEYMDPEFLQQLRRLAVSFTLGEGESRTLELKLMKRP
jgi:protocatechuate 3,4-dioxygenase beta subunit